VPEPVQDPYQQIIDDIEPTDLYVFLEFDITKERFYFRRFPGDASATQLYEAQAVGIGSGKHSRTVTGGILQREIRELQGANRR
jgi:hypothetical protein